MAASPTSDAVLRQRAQGMLETLVQVLKGKIPPGFVETIEAGGPRAEQACEQLQQYLTMSCDQLIQRCAQERQQGAWQALSQDARLAQQLATAIGNPRHQAQAALLSADASRGLGDNSSAISALRVAIDAAAEARDRRMLAIANGNLANRLRDSGRIDDAMPLYEEALGWEDDPKGRQQIRSNQAQALSMLGELRKALALHRERIAELESSGAPPRDLSVALSLVASDEIKLGAAREALALLTHARTLIADDDADGLAINALQRANALRELDDRGECAAAFQTAWTLARARADKQLAAPKDAHYELGFRRACLTRMPAARALELIIGGVAAKGEDEWKQAQQRFNTAHATAQQAGDVALCLRIEVNAAAALANAGQVEQAGAMLDEVRSQAGQRGLSLPEAMATGALGSISERTDLSFDSLGAMGLYARAQALADLHARILQSSSLDAHEQRWDLAAIGTGTLDNQLALLAQGYHADAFAAAAFERAARVVADTAPSFELANRLSGLLDAFGRLDQRDDADRIAARLAGLIATGALRGRALLAMHRALGDHLVQRDPATSIAHYRQACAAAVALRAELPPGPMRSEINRDYPHLHRTLAHLLQQQGLAREAFDAVQHDKARRLTDMLAWRRGVSDAPPGLAQVQTRLAPDDLLVDLVLYRDGITAYLVRAHDLRCVRIEGDTRALTRVEFGDITEREQALLQLCATDPLLIALVQRISAEADPTTRLIVVPDDALHNLPLHIVPLKGRAWCETHPLSYLPAAGVLGMIDAPVSSRTSFVAGDSALNLSEASAECARVASWLGTVAIVGSDCSRSAVEGGLRERELDIVHLAVHGRGDPARGGRASLMFGDDGGGVEWVSFDELAALRWRANLVVLSGCSTGVAGPRAGHELESVARAAIEAGAASVIACLWPVGDAVARAFMEAFHAALVRERAHGEVDLRLAIAEAQSAVQRLADSSAISPGQRRDGRVSPTGAASGAPTGSALWAPFVLLGRTTLPA